MSLIETILWCYIKKGIEFEIQITHVSLELKAVL